MPPSDPNSAAEALPSDHKHDRARVHGAATREEIRASTRRVMPSRMSQKPLERHDQSRSQPRDESPDESTWTSEAGEGLSVRLTGRNLEITNSIRDHARERLKALATEGHPLSRVSMVLEAHGREPSRRVVEIHAFGQNGREFRVRDERGDLCEAMDSCVFKLGRQLSRAKKARDQVED